MFSSRVEAHGTEGLLEEGTGIRVVARYDDVDPMSFAKVTISCTEQEGENATHFQTGKTDRNGNFIFIPEVDGKYRVTVQDEMGHQLVLGKTVKQVQNNSDGQVIFGCWSTIPGSQQTDRGNSWCRGNLWF